MVKWNPSCMNDQWYRIYNIMYSTAFRVHQRGKCNILQSIQNVYVIWNMSYPAWCTECNVSGNITYNTVRVGAHLLVS